MKFVDDIAGSPLRAFCAAAVAIVLLILGNDTFGDEAEFVSLFDGKTLEGWDGDPRFWRVEEGAIVGQTTADVNPENNTFLIHRGGDYRDFELRLSYQVEGFNSGVQYRSVDKGNWSVAGYQCDFEARWHKAKKRPSAPLQDKFSGMFFDEQGRMFLGQRGEAVIVRTNPKNNKKPFIERIASLGDPGELETHIRHDDWNELVVIANGNQFTHIINSQVMAIGIDEDEPHRRDSGLFAFQLHKGTLMKIRVKDVRVRRLDGNQNEIMDGGSAVGQTTSAKHDRRIDNADYESFALQHPGDASNGKRLFVDQRTKCSTCHRVNGNGGDVGKDLSAIGGKFGRPHLIESLLEPSRQIVEGYRTTTIMMADGRVFSGIVKSQTDTAIMLADATGKMHTIDRAEIESEKQSDVSIMPSGLAQQLSKSEFADLIAYLESLGSPGKKFGAGVRGAIELPDGFTAEVVATGLDGLTALDVLPDGRVLVCEQPGRVRIIDNGELLKTPVIELPVDSWWERGVIGVTHDPEFENRPYIYVCWVAKDPHPHHIISRFTMKGNVADPASEKRLLVGDDQTQMGGKVPAGHQGGAMHFGPDGKLYIAIGEQTAGAPSQKLDTFLGKILRINPDGSIPADNPFVDTATGKYRAIWAYGCRNPFTFAFRQSDGLMLINDVGGKFEEINVGRAGANYGWPVVEHGDNPKYDSGAFDGPIHQYPQSSINGGDFCTNPIWPAAWQGRFFFADFIHGWIKTIDPSDSEKSLPFVTGIRQPVDLRFAGDGSLYVLLRNAWVIDKKFGGGTGAVLRIRPTDVTQSGNVTVTSTAPTKKSVIVEAVPDDSPSKSLGPKPGDVYREFAIHNGGNLNWRVTDPKASAEGAKQFLPNPILSLDVADLEGAVRAEVLLDRWGGHPGTKQKQVRFNDNAWITLPEISTTPEGHDPEDYYSQDNPVFAVPLEHLRVGKNNVEGTIGPSNKTSWGQWGLYSLIVRVYYDPEVVGPFATAKITSPRVGETFDENPTIRLACDKSAKRVDVLAWYDSYDEDGNGVFNEWHGSRFQPARGKPAKLSNHVGTLAMPNGESKIQWNTQWVPDQKQGGVKLVALTHHENGFISVSEIVHDLSLRRDGFSVRQYRASDVPERFGVRVGQSKTCTIGIDAKAPLDRAVEAVLHYRTWEGDDRHHKPFQLNGSPHLNRGNNHHYDYDLLPIPVDQLKRGDNEFTISSDFDHHMLEVLWPGPAITVRYRTD